MEGDLDQQTSLSKQDIKTKLDISGSGAWLDAHHDPVASLHTFTNCIDLEDLDGNGEFKLLIGDLGSGQHDMKLKIYQGTELIHETPLLDLPTAVNTFMIDTHEPAVAVCSGSYVYIYKTVRPYFKFTLPLLEVNQKENELWQLLKEDKIDVTELRNSLEIISTGAPDPPLTVRSMTFLQLEPEDLQPFISVFKQIPLKKQTVVTSMTVLYKSYSDDAAARCLIIGTENKDLYVLDPAAFTFLSRMQLPSVPVFISATGIYDVDYSISVACRDACVYTIKSDFTPTRHKLPKISLSSQPCGLIREDKMIYVGTMDQHLSCYTSKGKCIWNVPLPDCITSMERMDHKLRNFKAVIVSLGNKEVCIYKDKYLVNKIIMDDIIVGMRFGQFGREEGALILIGQGGSLTIKILKRSVVFEPKDVRPGAPQSQFAKLNIPKKTKVFVDQTIRERDNGIVMHQTFQKDLLQLQLEASRLYAKAIQKSLAPMTNSTHTSLNISAQVQGVGPIFKVTVTMQNTSPNLSIIDYYLLFQSDETLYNISKKMIKLPMLVPSLSYTFSTMVECLNDYGQTDAIKVYVHCSGNPIPLLTAVIDMPASESFVV